MDKNNTAFQKLKDLLTQAKTLAYFKNECGIRIAADAGPIGIGAVLTQLQDGLWRVISCESTKRTDLERRYSSSFTVYLQQVLKAICMNRGMGPLPTGLQLHSDLSSSWDKHRKCSLKYCTEHMKAIKALWR